MMTMRKSADSSSSNRNHGLLHHGGLVLLAVLILCCSAGCHGQSDSTRIFVANGNFENENQRWQPVEGKGVPVRECGTRNALSKDCAYVFTGGVSEGSRIRSRLNMVPPGDVGDVYDVRFFLKGVNVSEKRDFIALVKIYDTLEEGPLQNYVCRSEKSGSFDYTDMTCTVVIDQPFQFMFLFFEYRGQDPMSRVYLDLIRLEHSTSFESNKSICSEDTDCEVKNVGNCCGYFEECVNTDFIPDPDNACPDGGPGICGSPTIDSCVCTSGVCTGVTEDLDEINYNKCSEDNDCEVKNVGNCCGEYLECVYTGFIPDPDNACPDGGPGICGYPDIAGCVCTSGVCTGVSPQDLDETNYNICSEDNDCEVKNVGNCCGYFEECVNTGFIPDPDNACPDGGTDICGFTEISHCVCTSGVCTGVTEDFDETNYNICSEDTDCEIKNVGNCCGYFEECVNTGFIPDPDNACPDGGGGICGFTEYSHCVCTSGVCTGVTEDFDDTNYNICSEDNDCEIKNVGNCCGDYLECVNTGFIPDPDNACPDGGASVCGFSDIDSCVCTSGVCTGVSE